MRRMAFDRRLVSAVDFSSARKDAFGGEWPRQAVAVCGTRRTQPVTGTNARGDERLTAVDAKTGNQARKTPDQSCCPRGPEAGSDAREPLVRHPTRQSQPCPPATSSPNGSGARTRPSCQATAATHPVATGDFPAAVNKGYSHNIRVKADAPSRMPAKPPDQGASLRECRIIPANG